MFHELKAGHRYSHRTEMSWSTGRFFNYLLVSSHYVIDRLIDSQVTLHTWVANWHFVIPINSHDIRHVSALSLHLRQLHISWTEHHVYTYTEIGSVSTSHGSKHLHVYQSLKGASGIRSILVSIFGHDVSIPRIIKTMYVDSALFSEDVYQLW